MQSGIEVGCRHSSEILAADVWLASAVENVHKRSEAGGGKRKGGHFLPKRMGHNVPQQLLCCIHRQLTGDNLLCKAPHTLRMLSLISSSVLMAAHKACS